jgi:hypothetical protein
MELELSLVENNSYLSRVCRVGRVCLLYLFFLIACEKKIKRIDIPAHPANPTQIGMIPI